MDATGTRRRSSRAELPTGARRVPGRQYAVSTVRCEAPDAAFARSIARAHPSVGPSWLRDLGAVQRRLAAEWQLTSMDWLPARGSCVMRAATAAGTDVVVKIPVIAQDTVSERRALAYWDGDGAPRLLRSDARSGALLIAWVDGRAFVDEPDTRDTLRAAGDFLRALHRPKDASRPRLPTLEEKLAPWRRSREQAEGSPLLDAATLRSEAAVRTWLAGSVPATTVIHGDLHPRNLLVRRDGALSAIDPYGIAGEPARDVASLGLFFREDARAPHRLDALAASTGADRDRVAGYAYALAVGALRFRVAYGIAAGRAFLEHVIGDLQRRLPGVV